MAFMRCVRVGVADVGFTIAMETRRALIRGSRQINPTAQRVYAMFSVLSGRSLHQIAASGVRVLALKALVFWTFIEPAVRVGREVRFCTMSVACSISRKSLDSPLSHQELFGVEHPLTKGRPKTKKVRRKTESSLSGKLTTTVSSASSSSKHKRNGKRSKSTLSTVEPTTCTQKTSPVKPQKSLIVPIARPPARTPLSSLARVDTDSPKPLRMRKSSAATKSSFVAKSSSETGMPTKMHNLNGRVNGQWKTKDQSPTFGVKPSASTPSKLTGSRYPTTGATSLGLSSSVDNLRSPITGTSINALMNRKVSSVSLPPYIQMPRRTFESVAERKGRPLTISDVAMGLSKLQYGHVIVMSGAGISTPSGIPDFRTPGTGLYDNLQQYRIPDPTAIFDITFFAHNPKPFFTLARELYPGKYEPNPVHHFVRLLQDKGLLLRNYTQNIDGLERLAGVKPGKLVEAHGSFATASCTRCKSKQDSEEARATIFRGQVPRCKHKYCMGVVKPDIVFFGEDLPQRFYSLRLPDFSHCDLLIVMGTSLEVEPFASLVSLPRFDVPRVLINREVVGPFKRHRMRPTDVVVTGDLVQSVWTVAEGAGWLTELEELCGRSGEEEEEEERGEVVTVVKSVSAESAVEYLDRSQDINNSTPVETIAGSEGHSVVRENPKNVFDDDRQVEIELCSSVSGLTLSDVQKPTPSSNSTSRQELVEREEWQVSDVFANLKEAK